MTVSKLNNTTLADEGTRKRLTEACLKSTFFTTSKYAGYDFFKILARDLVKALDVFKYKKNILISPLPLPSRPSGLIQATYRQVAYLSIAMPRRANVKAQC
jgi:predicted amidophosphoribosyltransferase